MNARLDTEPYKSLRAYPLADRLFIGGLKNLLCGATTVAHHGPPHKPMYRKDFPVRVLKNYGWAHSLHFNTEAEVIESYRKTPKDWPWFIHLAEGTDEVAASEYQRLKALGCVGPNTVIVHGVGMTEEDIADAAPKVRGLVWCPTTNDYLLDKTANVKKWVEEGGRLAVGSDSRLTAEQDWFDELRYSAYKVRDLFVPDTLLTLMFAGGKILNEQVDSSLDIGSRVDFWLWGAFPVRDNIPLVVKNGIPQIGWPDLMTRFTQVQTIPATLDGVPKAIHIDLARRIHHCTLKEPGLEVDALPSRRFWLI
jgi:hypothetical protein